MQIELIEMDKLDGVPFHHGLGSWYVPDANYNENGMSYSSTDEVPPLQLGGRIRSTMFPPADSSIRAMLRLSARVLPTDDFNAGNNVPVTIASDRKLTTVETCGRSRWVFHGNVPSESQWRRAIQTPAQLKIIDSSCPTASKAN